MAKRDVSARSDMLEMLEVDIFENIRRFCPSTHTKEGYRGSYKSMPTWEFNI